jgi:hypothetical protein
MLLNRLLMSDDSLTDDFLDHVVDDVAFAGAHPMHRPRTDMTTPNACPRPGDNL